MPAFGRQRAGPWPPDAHFTDVPTSRIHTTCPFLSSSIFTVGALPQVLENECGSVLHTSQAFQPLHPPPLAARLCVRARVACISSQVPVFTRVYHQSKLLHLSAHPRWTSRKHISSLLRIFLEEHLLRTCSFEGGPVNGNDVCMD